MEKIDVEKKYGYVYKLTCNETGKCYYGSTKKDINLRLNQHKSQTKTNKGSCRSKEIIENGNFKIETIEKVELDKLLDRENFYIENNDCINCKTRGRPKLPEKVKKTVYKKFPKEYFKEYYHKTNGPVKCSCGKEVNKRNLSQHKKSRQHIDYCQILEQIN